jgi:hypothetical protein
MSTRVAIAIAISALLIAVILYVMYGGSKPACTLDTDCTAPQTCVSGTCTDPVVVPSEVYHYDEGIFAIHNADAQSIAAKFGAKIASESDIAAAQAAGADWCRWGWLDNNTIAYPLAGPTAFPYCPDGTPPPGGKVFSSTSAIDNTWGVTLYGPKPPKSTIPECSPVLGLKAKSLGNPCIVPFSSNKWSQYL